MSLIGAEGSTAIVESTEGQHTEPEQHSPIWTRKGTRADDGSVKVGPWHCLVCGVEKPDQETP